MFAESVLALGLVIALVSGVVHITFRLADAAREDEE